MKSVTIGFSDLSLPRLAAGVRALAAQLDSLRAATASLVPLLIGVLRCEDGGDLLLESGHRFDMENNVSGDTAIEQYVTATYGDENFVGLSRVLLEDRNATLLEDGFRLLLDGLESITPSSATTTWASAVSPEPVAVP
jgi:hypothetical protein